MSSRPSSLLIRAGLGLLPCLCPAAHGQTFLAAHFGHGADGFGDSMAMLGDLNGDGRSEYLIGDHADDTAGADAGRIQLRSGLDHALLLEVLGDEPGDWFGRQVAAMGDLDGDGVPDWAVSSSREEPTAGVTRGGRVALRSGLTGAVIRSWAGAIFQELGERMVALDDLDGDGKADIAFSRFPTTGSTMATVEVRSTGTGAILLSLPALLPNTGSNFAYSLTATSDLDGDGLGDLALGSYSWSVFGDHRLRLHSSATGALIHEFLVEVPAECYALAMLGDLDNDGVGDFAYSQTTQTNPPVERVTVVSGATFTELWSLPKPAAWSNMGRGLVSWPDIDGDGHDDLAVQYHQGIAWDYKVSLRSGLDGSALGHLAVDSAQFKKLGQRMVRGPDMDGDGVDDLLLGCTTPSFWGNPGAVRVVSGVCDGQALPYGSGLAGSGGFTPQLQTVGCPAPGVPATLAVSAGLGSAPATLVIGVDSAALPFKQGTLLVDPVGAVLVTVPLSSPSGVPGAGHYDFDVLLPDEPLLSGLSAWLQVLVRDAGAPSGWALSPGVEWRFG